MEKGKRSQIDGNVVVGEAYKRVGLTGSKTV